MDINFELASDNIPLLRRLRAGDMDAFSSIYNEYWDELYRLAHEMLGERNCAEDVIHDVFADLWERRKKLHIKETLRGYLLVCVRNRCLKTLRKRNKTEELPFYQPIESASLHDILHYKELQERLQQLLDKLPRKSKEIFALSREEELSYKEIAHRTNLSIKSVEYHISKVLVKLRSAILLGLMTLLG